jgi:hypothetical protein
MNAKRTPTPDPNPAPSIKPGETWANHDGDEVSVTGYDPALDVVSYRNGAGMSFSAPGAIFFGGMTKR